MQIFGRTTPLICLRSFELRLSRSWTPPSQSFDDSVIEPQPMWVLCSVFPEMTEDGEVKEIVGCVTDIRCDYISTKKHSGTHAQFSQQKWSEKLQENQASNAQESKRQVDSNSCLWLTADFVLGNWKTSLILHRTSKDHRTSLFFPWLWEQPRNAKPTVCDCAVRWCTSVHSCSTATLTDISRASFPPIKPSRRPQITKRCIKRLWSQPSTRPILLCNARSIWRL